MKEFLLNANEQCELARERKIPLSNKAIAAFGKRYDAILREGEQENPAADKLPGKRGRSKQSLAFNLLRRMRQYVDAMLLFIRDPSVPFANNLGERAVRMPKVKQKISGCFRTLEGDENFCVIRSCLDTLLKQGHGTLDVLRHAFAGNPI